MRDPGGQTDRPRAADGGVDRDATSLPDEAAEPTGAQRLKRWLLWTLRIGGTVAAFGYIASIVELDELTDAALRVSGFAFVGACLVTALNVSVGVLRWRVLLTAYGAERPPSLLRMAHVYAVGFFYNTYLPGGVGGDVLRGMVTRRAFGKQGAAASVTVVLVERVLGLSGLLIVVASAYLIRPLEGASDVLPYSALGLVVAALAVAAVAVGRRLAPLLPRRLAAFASRLPSIERPFPFVLALLLSLVTQGLAATTGWLLLDSASGGAVALMDAFVLVPLAMAAAFFPFSVGGAGVREAAFVALCTTVLSMSEADATAASLLLWATQLAIGAAGGLVQLAAPLDRPETAEVPEDPPP